MLKCWIALTMSALALGLSIATVVRANSTDPLGMRAALASYDFSTPDAAIKSFHRMNLPSEHHARLAYALDRGIEDDETAARDACESVRVEAVLEREGDVYCFESYSERGVPKKKVTVLKRVGARFEKTYGSPYELTEFSPSGERHPTDERAAQILKKWREWCPDEQGLR